MALLFSAAKFDFLLFDLTISLASVHGLDVNGSFRRIKLLISVFNGTLNVIDWTCLICVDLWFAVRAATVRFAPPLYGV